MAESHRPGSRFAIPFRFWGVVMAGGTLMLLGFGEFQQELLHQYRSWQVSDVLPGIICCLVLLILLTVTMALVAYLRPTPQRSLAHLARMVGEARRQWLPVALGLGLAGTLLWFTLTRDWVLPTVVANAAIIGLALWLMRVGLRDDRALPFSFGVL